MKSRTRLVAGFAAAALAVAAVVGYQTFPRGASAGQGGALDDGKDLLPKAGISLSQAITAAQTAATGAVDEVDLEYWNGTLVYNVDVGSKDVKVDAASGAVLEASEDD
jgi:uncharacterized membrane protein YkoI